jgi:uncharacterized protein YndB with AHSA1/START domain
VIENAPIERSVRVRCSVEHAFRVFTSRIDVWWPVGHARAPGGRVVLEPCVGGRFFVRTGEGEVRLLGCVVRWEPPSRVTYTWYPGAVDSPTAVDVRFSPDGEDTVVDVTHSEGDSQLGALWPERAKTFERAWGEVLPAFERQTEAEEGD